MIFHNKILLVLIGCMITNSCFAAVCTCQSGCTNCTCEECTETDIDCSGNTCKKITETVTQTICSKESYISECAGTDYSFENVLATWTSQQYRFKPKCWAVDGSLTTAQHYQNMRALFALEAGIDSRIANMDENSSTELYEGCKETTSKDALEMWLSWLSTSCLNNIGGTEGLSYVCKTCPDGGKTGVPTKVKYKITVTKNSAGKVIQRDSPQNLEWLKFNTIANCYITRGEDERGEFELNDSDAKCYYSKE